MIKSAEQLILYKKVLAKLKKNFPKGETNWTGFTISIAYGGNKQFEPDLERICLGGIATEKPVGDDFLKLLIKSTEDQIKFWEDTVQRDIKELQNSLKL